MTNNLKEIKEFINQWKARARQYIPETIEEYRTKRQEIESKYDFYSQWEQRRQAQRKLAEEYPLYIRELAYGYSSKDKDERIEKLIEKEAEEKEKKLIARVNKSVGTIVEALSLNVGVNGELNGYIKGENGTCKIETIYAGGYNIQCLHYRVLVNVCGSL